jgi:hypothetical protein
MQMGLRRSEQREVDGLTPTTLAPAMQRRRVVGRVAEMTERLGRWTEEQGHVLDRLARLAPKTQEMVAQAIEKLRPVIEKAAERIQQRPERMAARKQEVEMNAARAELLALRMRAFEQEQRAGSFYIAPARERQRESAMQTQEGKERTLIHALDRSELLRVLQREKTSEIDRRAQIEPPIRAKGISLGR